MRRRDTIAVAIHDVEPATFERCALIRDWLDDHGVDRVTLLVIPAPDLHPFFQRRPELAAWLLDCRDRGDAIASTACATGVCAAPPRCGGRSPAGRAAAPPSSRASTPPRPTRRLRRGAARSNARGSSRGGSSHPR